MSGNETQTTDTNVSPFLTPTLNGQQKTNEISQPENGLELTDQICTGKDGSRPFLGTIRGLDNELSLQTKALEKSPTTEVSLCTTRLCHPRIRKVPAKHYVVRRSAESTCSTSLYHQRGVSLSPEQFSENVTSSSAKAGLNLSEGVQPDVEVGSEAYEHDEVRPFPDADREHSDLSGRGRTKAAPIRSGLIVRGRSFYIRWKVPTRLQPIIGKTHFVKSLRTGRLNEALRHARTVGAEFEQLLLKAEGRCSELSLENLPSPTAISTTNNAVVSGKTFEQVFEMFINDPTRKRAKKTISGYHEAIEVIYDVIAQDTPIGDIDRETCRRLLEILQWLPTNSSKRFPKLSAVAASMMAKKKRLKDTLGPVSINGYMITLSSILNFAVNEGIIGRNPTKGLRVIDPVKKRDKRLPFSDEQLGLIFNSSIYREEIKAHRDTAHYWVSLIALFSGMRLNEICALDVADIQTIEGTLCFLIRETADKSLKTIASERFVPLHQCLVEIGFANFIVKRRAEKCRKLFPELKPSSNGHYSVGFSKWFGRFTRKIGAQRDRTCFHSFRHNFRDALREAKTDHEVALSLGGWTSSTGKTEVHSNYGRGFTIKTLKDAMDKIAYPCLKLDHLADA